MYNPECPRLPPGGHPLALAPPDPFLNSPERSPMSTVFAHVEPFPATRSSRLNEAFGRMSALAR